MDAPARSDLYAIGRAYVYATATNIDPSAVDTQGSDANLFVGSQSFIASAVVRQLQDRFAAQFIASSRNDDLDRKLWDSYKLPRKGASASVGGYRFYRLSTAAGAGTIPVGTNVQSITGYNYVTTSTATFGVDDYEATCSIRSTAAGSQFNVGPNQIRIIPKVSTLFDPSLQGTNYLTTAGGDDREQDDQFRLRGENYWPTARRGVLSAIAYGAQSTPGVQSANVVEVLDSQGNPARVCEVFIADPAGQASQELADSVTSALLDYRAAGIQAPIILTTPLIVAVQLHLAFQAGTVTGSLTETIRNAVVSYVNSTPTGQPLYRNGLGSVLARYQRNGLLPNNSAIVSPPGDLVPGVGQTIRTTLANVTIV